MPLLCSIRSKKPLSISHIYLYFILTFVMLVTRGNHFETLAALPSASLAIFFLAGMYLRHLPSFWYFYLLTIIIDLSASYARGQLSSCITPAYAMLAGSYITLWIAGAYLKPKWTTPQSSFISLVGIFIGLMAAASIAFFISNGSYYALSGKFDILSWSEYASRVQKYFYPYITNPLLYVAIGLSLDAVLTTLKLRIINASLDN